MIDFNNKWPYGEQQKKLINNDFTSAIDINLYKSIKHFYYWTLSVYNKSYSLRINNQLQAGGGVAYIFIDKPNFKIKITDEILYDFNDVYLADTTREVFQTPRNSLGLNIKYYYKTRFSFTSSFFVQNSLQQRNDVIYKGEADLKIQLTRLLSLASKLTYNKINRTERENLFITFGLAFDTYF
ncbi:hypothetical protein [Aurantibacillus circumpalustris]|uniref:hypothetical protein n=1 Tax=Aurantibacillus circumpalustris TaxID=3036359 RepID=UPI00295AA5B1|nr:hypothetical protein [Aurantibacillus circumpalustris]